MNRICLTVVILLFLVSGCWWFRTKPEIPPPPPPEEMGLLELKKYLYSEDPGYRTIAADRLVLRGDKRARRTLAKALRKAPDEVVLSILKVLTMRHDERYIKPLIDVLEIRNPDFHNLIFEIFKYYERENLTAALLDKVEQEEKSIEAKQSIVMALGKVRSKKSVEPLINLFGNNDGDLDEEINNTLKQITQHRFSTKEEWLKWWKVYKDKPREIWLDEAVNNYQRLLNQKNSRIEKLTAELVSLKIDKLEQAKKLQPAEGVLQILLAALDDDYWQIQKYAVEQLHTLPEDNRNDVLPKLIEMTGVPEEELRNTVVVTLGEIGDESVVPSLINLLSNPKEKVSVRKNTALALGKIGSPKATPALTNILKENSSLLLVAVIEALGKMGDKSSIPALIGCLEDKEKPDKVHIATIDALGEIKDPSSIAVIIKFVADSRDRFRWSAANSLGKIGSETALPALIKLLEDEFADIRQISVESLGDIGSKNAAPVLVKTLLNDKDLRVKELSAIALGKIKTKQSLPGLLNALSDTNERVVHAAWNSALEIINGDINLMIETAKQLEEAKHLSRAVEIYEKIIKISDKPEYTQALLRCYKGLGKIDEVIKSSNDLLTRQPQNSPSWWELKTELVSFLYTEKEYDKTLKEIKGLLNNNSIPQSTKQHLERIKEECENALKVTKPPSE